MTGERPPKTVLIHRDSLKPASESIYRAIEEEAARICAELNCPHPHLALESLTAPTQVWWLNAFESEAEKQKALDGYAGNRPLLAALETITKRREGLLSAEAECFAEYRADLSRGGAWKVAGVRFFAVAVTRESTQTAGSVFEAPDGTRFIFRALTTRDESEAMTLAIDSDAILFAVRPYWGFPAKDWVSADPAFWTANPAARTRQPT